MGILNVVTLKARSAYGITTMAPEHSSEIDILIWVSNLCSFHK
jgi:hypothetical protein